MIDEIRCFRVVGGRRAGEIVIADGADIDLGIDQARELARQLAEAVDRADAGVLDRYDPVSKTWVRERE